MRLAVETPFAAGGFVRRLCEGPSRHQLERFDSRHYSGNSCTMRFSRE